MGSAVNCIEIVRALLTATRHRSSFWPDLRVFVPLHQQYPYILWIWLRSYGASTLVARKRKSANSQTLMGLAPERLWGLICDIGHKLVIAVVHDHNPGHIRYTYWGGIM